MKGKRLRGFTLIELIVVIAIIGVLAAILVPSMLGYIRNARMRNFNSNAATVFKGAQLACVDALNAGKTLPANTVYVNSADGDCECDSEDNNASLDMLDITDYVGAEFEGYFGFITDAGGSGCSFAVWSDTRLTAAEVVQLSDSEVKAKFSYGQKPIGCHPLKLDSAA